MENDDYKAQLEKLYEKLFSVLNEKDKPTLRKIKLSHQQREKELSVKNKMYEDDRINNKKELSDIVDQIESITKQLDQTNQLTIKLKNIISSFRKNRKELLSTRQGDKKNRNVESKA